MTTYLYAQPPPLLTHRYCCAVRFSRPQIWVKSVQQRDAVLLRFLQRRGAVSEGDQQQRPEELARRCVRLVELDEWDGLWKIGAVWCWGRTDTCRLERGRSPTHTVSAASCYGFRVVRLCCACCPPPPPPSRCVCTPKVCVLMLALETQSFPPPMTLFLRPVTGNQGGSGSYPVSHNSRENLSQGGGGSSNGYGFYGSVTTAAAASRVGSSLGGMAFVNSPSTPSDFRDRRNPPRGGGGGGGPFSWLLGWRKGAGGEQAGGRGGGGSGAPPSLWQRSQEHNNDYISSTQSTATASRERIRSRSLDTNIRDENDRGDGGGGGGSSVVGAVSRWWRGAFDGIAGRRGSAAMERGGGDGGGAAGEASSLWKTHGSGAATGGSGGGKSHLSFGELSRSAEVTYSLRGYEAGAEGEGAKDRAHGSTAEWQGGSGGVGAARGGQVSSSSSSSSSAAAVAGREAGRGGVGGVAVGARQAVGW